MMRQRIEIAVVRLLLVKMRAAGFVPTDVDDGEDCTSVTTDDDVMRLVFNLDDSKIYFRMAGRKSEEWAKIVLGNSGDDCISDYGVGCGRFEAVMDEVSAIVEHGAVTFAPCPGKSLAWDAGPTNQGPCINCGTDHTL